ncbi:hypothetical protein OKW40_001127 [Paraburkholderia sp. RAU6.4a]
MPFGPALQTLDRHVVAKPRDDDLAVLRFGALLHREQVAVENARVAHRQAAHLQQVVGLAREQRRVTRVVLRDMFLREDRATRRDPADQRQRQLHQARMRQGELIRRVLLPGQQADAARRAGREFDHALARQRAQMFFRGIGRTEAEFGGNFRASGRKAGAFDRAADQIENLLLSCGEFCHGHCMYEQVTVFLYSIRRISSFTLSSAQGSRWGVVYRRHDGVVGVPTAGASVVTTFEH